MTNRLTLATGSDFWDGDAYHDGGSLWCIRWDEDQRLDLTPEVEAWCIKNLRRYEVKQVPGDRGWLLGTGSLVIEFDHPGDMLLFKATWGDA